MTSTHHTSRPRPDEPTEPPGRWLAEAAEHLQTVGEFDDWRPILVGAVGPGPSDRRGRLEVVDLEGSDPVAELLGVVAPSRVRAVGLLAAGRAQLVDDDAVPVRGGFVHLVDRDGVSVTRTVDAAGRPLVIGPTAEVQSGRVPDACRRALGLPTAPPPADTVPVVVDEWLGRVIEAAGRRLDLTWDDVVALHADPDTPCTPSELARRTVRAGEELSWAAVRRAFADGTLRAHPDIDAATAEWMDDGMLARWVIGTALPWASLLEIVDALVAPEVSDLVVATVGMCPPPSWPAL